MSLDRLPAIPVSLLRRHTVYEPSDNRFRASARLLQALWRESEGLPIGHCVSADGTVRPLGSRIAGGAESGRNFLSPEIAQLAWRETVYRELGAAIDEQRLWANLLSSQVLSFNVVGPMSLSLNLATAFLRAMAPDLVEATAIQVLFEHSPGRRDPSLTGDNTAFDAFISYQRADQRTGFVAMEFKYSKSGRERQGPVSASCEAAMVASQLFRDVCAPALRAAPLQQLTREHVLAQAMVSRGEYNEGRLVVIGPMANPAIGKACKLYQAHLSQPKPAHAGFDVWSLDAVIEALRLCGHAGADGLFRRYVDWAPVADAIRRTQPQALATDVAKLELPSRPNRANRAQPRPCSQPAL